MNTHLPILPELNNRRSVRYFAGKEIEPEKIAALFEAARWAPSSSNRQGWHYYAATGAARLKFKDILTAGNQYALEAPLLIGVVRHGPGSPEYAMYNTALSAMSLVVEAEHQGLRARQMAGFDEEKFRTILNIKPEETPVVVIAVGYEGKLEDAGPEIQEKEGRPRERKPIEEVVTFLRD